MPLKQPHFLALLAAVTILFGTVYLTVQQSLRSTADDPQIQIAEDAATALSFGVEPRSLLPGLQTEMERSISPFIAIYDEGGVPIVSSATLDGQLPKLPADVLRKANEHGQYRVTWQPEPDLHIALVVQQYKSQDEGYVAVGRSLRETSRRTLTAGLLTLGGWLLTVSILIGTEYAAKRPKK